MPKDKAFGSILGLVLTISVGFIDGGRQGGSWRGTIQEVDSVTVVKNPKERMYGLDACSLKEDFLIGTTKAGDEYLFSEIRDLGVDEAENIYVLDFKEPFVKVFDKSGNRLRTIGKRGQGPGEIQGPTSLCVTPRGELLVNDRGNRLFYIFSYQFDITPNVWDVYPPDCFWRVGSHDSIVWGYADKYELQSVDGHGKAIRKIAKDYTPVETTEEEKKEWIQFAFGDKGIPSDATVNWPKYHNAFQFLSVDDRDKIFVQTYEKTADGKGYF